MPPKPILIRWATWISVALYYAENYDSSRNVIDSLDEEDAASIKIIKDLLQKEELRADLSYIKAHFGILPNAIQSLEQMNLPLLRTLKIFEDTVSDLSTAPGDIGKLISAKFKRVTDANKGLKTVKVIRNILAGLPGIHVVDLLPDEIASFKFANFCRS